MSTIFKRGPARPQANITPMIDVTFLLIVFFVLVSQIVDLENVDLELPAPDHAATRLPGEEPRAVVNVLPGPSGKSSGYRVAGESFEATPAGVQGLRSLLVELFQATPQMRVNLRADRRTAYRWVAPVFQAVRQAAVMADVGLDGASLNLVVVREEQ